ncbi:sodium ABC transporter ATP-binding protein [Sporosarcina sp. P21c]|uniref:ABC transporter ATP-binding protein n=1 Tax=unclassified Sporosarcina TaxID=2647733 RepID=UPI000C171084|nr:MULTISPECIES: ABC transporter ATP-binding protein [unclassified Sporosarcina]PIC66201.1 sodium ABC transporter ATP-binding protein [Sporosarcina sp. P16a]PIC90162.1 sodium ABC transporter ATP-binding protein [Sporosarcina sp. P21c]PIC91905.1 sodium ABC transporter ATP-binding protein [Sporosarcina sp. P25]
MENVIEFHGVSKKVQAFSIDNMDIQIKQGYITGFIGTNGSGKSTMIKLMMNLLQPDKGRVSILGLDYASHEKEIKDRIGFVYDSNIFYESLNLKDISKIVAPAYKQWDNKQFNEYVNQFELPLNKSIKNFSKGMQMKASIAIALSHNAELIIMDEPTAGLDPTFRRELLEIFQEFMVNEGRSIFFSTHTTSDLERFADYIVLVDKGEILFNQRSDELQEQYVLVKGSIDLLDRDTEEHFIHIECSRGVFQALTKDAAKVKTVFEDHIVIEKASLDEIMFYMKAAHRHKLNNLSL